jgi:hypothetical protein
MKFKMPGVVFVDISGKIIGDAFRVHNSRCIHLAEGILLKPIMTK